MPRFALQAELFGLTLAQRNQGAAAVQAALDSDAVNVTEAPNVDANKTIRGEVELFVDANFITDASIRRVFLAAYNWASPRATDSASGRHSYVRLREIDETAHQVTQRYAESPAWTITETVEPWGSLTG